MNADLELVTGNYLDWTHKEFVFWKSLRQNVFVVIAVREANNKFCLTQNTNRVLFIILFISLHYKN